MLRGATLLMRAVVLFIGLVVLSFGFFLFPEMARESAMVAEAAARGISPWFAYVHVFFLTGLYAAAVPFLFALYQTLRLLGYIDRKKAFSDLSVKVLRKIKYCGIAVCALYMLGAMPFLYCFAELDDAPGVVLIGLTVGLAPFVVAAFAAILQMLLQEAIAIKNENDLTI